MLNIFMTVKLGNFLGVFTLSKKNKLFLFLY